jgi:hypothetical protein
MYFRSCCRSCAILAPRGSPKCSKTAPRLDFLVFSTILGAILNRFLIIFHLHLNRISKSISPSMFDFLVQFLLSLSSSSLKFRHGGGLLRAAPWISAGPAKRCHGRLRSRFRSLRPFLKSSSRHPPVRAILPAVASPQFPPNRRSLPLVTQVRSKFASLRPSSPS